MASVFNFSLDQGATKRFRLVYRFRSGFSSDGEPVYQSHDLTGCTARMQVRNTQGGSILADLSEDHGISIQPDGELGVISVELSPTDTGSMTSRRAVYDLELTFPSGDIVRLIQGKISVSPNITE